jgi:hypothetical protein
MSSTPPSFLGFQKNEARQREDAQQELPDQHQAVWRAENKCDERPNEKTEIAWVVAGLQMW